MITKELSSLHLIPIEKDKPKEQDTTIRYLYLSINYLKKDTAFYTKLFPLLQAPLSRNRNIIFALEPVYSDGRIVEGEVVAEAANLKAHMQSIGIPEKQVIILPPVKVDTHPTRIVRVYLQDQ